MKLLILRLLSQIEKIFFFPHLGNKAVIKFPFKGWNFDLLQVGDSSFIAEGAYFALTRHQTNVDQQPVLKIGKNVAVGSHFFVAALDEVRIEDDVMLSDRVFICDHIHDYQDPNTPIKEQPLLPKGKVKIGRGSFIGINSVIMPGVTIGQQSVVGANSVVTHDVPNYSVVAGNPAQVIKQYNLKKKVWESKRHD